MSFKHGTFIAFLALLLSAAGVYAQDAVATPTKLPVRHPCSDTQPQPCTTPPRVTYQPDPQYTKNARKRRVEGTVVVWIVVGEDGRVQEAKVKESLDPDLDESAIKTVKRWKFKPSTYDGKPIPVSISVEITFHLDQS